MGRYTRLRFKTIGRATASRPIGAGSATGVKARLNLTLENSVPLLVKTKPPVVS